LLGRVAKGNRDAFEAVCQHIVAPVFGTARAVVRDVPQSEEVAQEVLVEVWQYASRFDASRGSALAWVTTIAHRRAVDRVRSEQRSAERELRAAASTVAYDDVVETAGANLDAERVRRCLRSLTELQREAVTLAYYGGYTYRQVAGLLGVAAIGARTGVTFCPLIAGRAGAPPRMACPIENPVTSPVGWIPVSECLVLPFLCRRPVAGTGVAYWEKEGAWGSCSRGPTWPAGPPIRPAWPIRLAGSFGAAGN